jgi:hypothetical protein
VTEKNTKALVEIYLKSNLIIYQSFVNGILREREDAL